MVTAHWLQVLSGLILSVTDRRTQQPRTIAPLCVLSLLPVPERPPLMLRTAALDFVNVSQLIAALISLFITPKKFHASHIYRAVNDLEGGASIQQPLFCPSPLLPAALYSWPFTRNGSRGLLRTVGREAAHEGSGPPDGSGPREHDRTPDREDNGSGPRDGLCERVTDLEDNQQHRGPLRIITGQSCSRHRSSPSTQHQQPTDPATIWKQLVTM